MALSISLAALAAVPAAAATIEEGTDYWRTPAGGTTFTFPDGDVESLCHVKPDPSWIHKVSLNGVPAKGSDWDTAVSRLTDARFDKGGTAHTRVRFKSLNMVSAAPSDTPCGKLNWTAHLAKGKQPTTEMKITKTSAQGGVFFAELALRVEMRATLDGTGAHVGTLFYDIKLDDPAGGTPWSFGAKNRFRAGMTPANDCVQVLRKKLLSYSTDSQHYYYISDLIAKGQCVQR